MNPHGECLFYCRWGEHRQVSRYKKRVHFIFIVLPQLHYIETGRAAEPSDCFVMKHGYVSHTSSLFILSTRYGPGFMMDFVINLPETLLYESIVQYLRPSLRRELRQPSKVFENS